MIRKNKGDFFYYMDFLSSEAVFFKKSKRVLRINLDLSVSKTKKTLYIKTVTLSDSGLLLFKKETSEFDYNVLISMLDDFLKSSKSDN